MTDIEQKALALVNEVLDELKAERQTKIMRKNFYAEEALCRAIEQHEAFRQEVSDAVGQHYNAAFIKPVGPLARFIIANPDPLEKALEEAGYAVFPDDLQRVRAAIEKRGGKIVWGEG